MQQVRSRTEVQWRGGLQREDGAPRTRMASEVGAGPARPRFDYFGKLLLPRARQEERREAPSPKEQPTATEAQTKTASEEASS